MRYCFWSRIFINTRMIIYWWDKKIQLILYFLVVLNNWTIVTCLIIRVKLFLPLCWTCTLNFFLLLYFLYFNSIFYLLVDRVYETKQKYMNVLVSKTLCEEISNLLVVVHTKEWLHTLKWMIKIYRSYYSLLKN